MIEPHIREEKNDVDCNDRLNICLSSNWKPPYGIFYSLIEHLRELLGWNLNEKFEIDRELLHTSVEELG